MATAWPGLVALPVKTEESWVLQQEARAPRSSPPYLFRPPLIRHTLCWVASEGHTGMATLCNSAGDAGQDQDSQGGDGAGGADAGAPNDAGEGEGVQPSS